jgi:hypothetical protein
MPELDALILALVGCAVAVLVQLIIWRVRLPQRQSQAIARIFAATFVIELAAVAALRPSFLAASFSVYVYATFAYLILTLCYIITYTAVEADSPTMLIMDRATAAGAQGITRQFLREELTDEALVWNRVEDLAGDGLIRDAGRRYDLTGAGRALVRIFIFQRRLLRLGKGG